MSMGDLKAAAPSKEQLAEQAKAKALKMGQKKLNEQIGADVVNAENLAKAKNLKGRASGLFGKMKAKMPTIKKPKMPKAPEMPKVPDMPELPDMPEVPKIPGEIAIPDGISIPEDLKGSM